MSQTEDFLASVEHYCEGLTVAVGCRGPGCEYAEGDEDHQCEPHFSWSQCDSCGSRFGGDRETAFGHVTKNPHTEPIEMSICVDCIMFHANGDTPEEWRQHPARR